jgi:serine O-acetyltransferase
VPKISTLIEELRRDYRRHGATLNNPALWAVAVYRFGNWSNGFDGLLGKAASKVYGALFLGIGMTTGIVFNREARVGRDFHLVHWGNTKIHPDSVIGDRCGIMHDVTLGTNMDRKGAPRIGNDVFIGAGAKVLGPVTIGDGARIAANSLVLSDVPPGATAVGVPARVLQYTGRGPAPAGDNGPTEAPRGAHREPS